MFESFLHAPVSHGISIRRPSVNLELDDLVHTLSSPSYKANKAIYLIQQAIYSIILTPNLGVYISITLATAMKFLVVLGALAATALANPLSPPPPPPPKCTPATYACAKNPKTGVDGWKVCDVTGTWVVS